MTEKTLSIVVPCYNEEKAVPIFMEEIKKHEAKMLHDYNLGFEYIFIDDGSSDNTSGIIKGYAQKADNVRYIVFSRNFGKEGALYAGLKNASGDYVVVMDVDLQDPPSLLEKMYLNITQEGYDCCATRRSTRKGEPVIRSFFAKIFYKIINKISNSEIVDGARDFRMMTRPMVDAILSMCEYNRFSKGIFGWVGFKTKWIEYSNVERAVGETKWSFWNLLFYSFDGIIAFSNIPLAISTVLGLLFLAVGFIMFVYMLVIHPSTYLCAIICAMFFFSGVNLICLGILSQYLAKTYLETKKRPVFIVKESNFNNDKK